MVAATALIGSVGCKGTSAEHSYPNDPLLISKKPVEGKTGSTRAVALVHHELEVPSQPSETVLVRAACPDTP
jgi:hypothetical protein